MPWLQLQAHATVEMHSMNIPDKPLRDKETILTIGNQKTLCDQHNGESYCTPYFMELGELNIFFGNEIK